MKKDEMREEYSKESLGKGVRGKYASAYHAENNLVLLEPEVAQAFPDDKSVNEALMSLIKLAKSATEPNKSLHRTDSPTGLPSDD